MLQPLQMSLSALQPLQENDTQHNLLSLPAGTTVFARLTAGGLYMPAELQGITSATSTANVTIFSSGSSHQVPLKHVVQKVVLDDEASAVQSGSSDGSDSDDASLPGDELAQDAAAEEDIAFVAHNPAALAVLHADAAASKVGFNIPAVDFCIGNLTCAT